MSEYKFLEGGGEMGEMIRSKDWSTTPLGSPGEWPAALKVAVGILLRSPFPMHITWGNQFTQLYNDGYRPLLGTTKHPQALGIPIWESFPEIWDTIGPMFHGVMRGEAVRITDFKLYLERNGYPEECYFDFAYSPIIDEFGEIGGVLTNEIETTEKVKTLQKLQETYEHQQALNEEIAAANDELALMNSNLLAAQREAEVSQTSLRLAINAANFGTWFIHSVTREFITDARLKELFGYYPDEDLSIEQALAQITDEYRPYVANKLENAIYNNGDYDVTYPVVGLHNNRLRWLRAIGNLKADPSGTFSAFTGVVMDITEQYLAAKNVERAEERLRMAIEAAGLGTFSIDADSRKFVASSKLKEFFGFLPDEEVPYEAGIGQIHPDYRQKVADQVEAAFTQGSPFDLEYPIIGYHDGKTRWVRGIGEMQHSEGKEYFTGVLHEITEKKMDELRKNDFIGMVSHELKTPLTSMTALLQILKMKLGKSNDAFVPDALQKANQQVKKMSNMINGFLNISRLESGKMLINKQPFIINDLIKETIEEINLTDPGRIFEFEGYDKVTIKADHDKIGSVLSNLLTNAVKYSAKETKVQVACVQLKKEVRISVTDHGMGIRPGDQERLFDRFYRVESNHTKYISGFGIGLYLSAEIIKRHQGRIWVESQEGKGSTFYFTLPMGYD